MAINLQKGEKQSLQGLSKIKIGLGWNPNDGVGSQFDLDASIFMLNSGRKVPTDGHFIFYNNLVSPDGGVEHKGDNRDGDGDGDDEVVMVDLNKVGSAVEEILFVVTIHDASTRKQNFGQVRNSYIRIVDGSNDTEIMKYELDEDFSIETSIEFGRLYKRNNEWKFEASGIGYKEDLGFFTNRYC
jgi:tellurium resistance protein TerD